MIYYKELCGTIILEGLLDEFVPPTVESPEWKYWRAELDIKTCKPCRSRHGKIYRQHETPDPEPPLHYACRCRIKPLRRAIAGQCSREGENGADWWLWNRGVLPDYYISLDEIISLGWFFGKSPVKYAPGKMIFGGVCSNEDGRLPNAPGRIWNEADLNYYSGRRNKHRLLWSNDGLMFVTYDHYETFIEVVGFELDLIGG